MSDIAQPGQPIRMRAATWNALVALLRRHGGAQPAGIAESRAVYGRWPGESALPAFTPTSYDYAGTPGDEEYRHLLVTLGATPDERRIAVPQSAIEPMSYGPVVVDGVTLCRIDLGGSVPEHRRLKLADSVLVPDAQGAAELLWWDTADEPTLGLVRLTSPRETTEAPPISGDDVWIEVVEDNGALLVKHIGPDGESLQSRTVMDGVRWDGATQYLQRRHFRYDTKGHLAEVSDQQEDGQSVGSTISVVTDVYLYMGELYVTRANVVVLDVQS